MVESNYITIYR